MARNARLEIEIDGDATGAVRAADRTSRAYQGMGRDLDGVDRSARTAGGGLSGLGGKLAAAGAVASGAAAGLGIAGAAAWKLSEAASDSAEAASAAEAVFGKAYSGVASAAQNAATTVGLTRTEYLDGAKTLGVLGSAAGLTGGDLGKFSTSLMSLVGDMASFHNAEPQEVLQALGSGLRGEAEPLRRFGILMDDATLKAQAMKMGLIQTTKQALTPQQKTLAAQQLILSQVGAAQGDFARTSDGMANQQRILKARLGDVTAELGTKLLPYAEKFLGWVNAMVPKVVAFAGDLGKTLRPVLGAVADALSGLTGQGNRTSGAVTGIQTVFMLATTAMRAGAGFIRGIVGPAFAGLRSAVDRVRAALAANPRVMQVVQGALSGLTTVLRGVGPVARVVGHVAGTVLGAAFDVMGGAISTAIGIVDRLIGAWQRARDIISGAVSGIKSAVSNLPGSGLLSKVLSFGRGSGMDHLVTAAGGPRLVTAASAGPWELPSLASTGGGGAYIAVQPTVQNVYHLTVTGPVDRGAAARELEQLMRRHNIMRGRG